MAQFRTIISLAGLALAFHVLAGPAAADETGFADMHSQARVGDRICMTDHSHQGSSEGQPNRKAAEADAIRRWSSFTDLEYGSDWANFRIAAGKTVTCDGSSGSWSCFIDARPCKSATRKVAKTRR